MPARPLPARERAKPKHSGRCRKEREKGSGPDCGVKKEAGAPVVVECPASPTHNEWRPSDRTRLRRAGFEQ